MIPPKITLERELQPVVERKILKDRSLKINIPSAWVAYFHAEKEQVVSSTLTDTEFFVEVCPDLASKSEKKEVKTSAVGASAFTLTRRMTGVRVLIWENGLKKPRGNIKFLQNVRRTLQLTSLLI